MSQSIKQRIAEAEQRKIEKRVAFQKEQAPLWKAVFQEWDRMFIQDRPQAKWVAEQGR